MYRLASLNLFEINSLHLSLRQFYYQQNMIFTLCQLAQAEDSEYLCMHLDIRLSWKKRTYQGQATWIQIKPNELAHWPQI